MSEIPQAIPAPVRSLGKIAEALSKAQATMSGAKKHSKNPYFNSKYSDLASVFEAIREPLTSNGLAVSQSIDVVDGKQVIRTMLLHVSGEYLESTMFLPVESNPQKLGSAITYYRRYSLMAICGLPAEDDDGNAASQQAFKEASEQEVEEFITHWSSTFDRDILESYLKRRSEHFKVSVGRTVAMLSNDEKGFLKEAGDYHHREKSKQLAEASGG